MAYEDGQERISGHPDYLTIFQEIDKDPLSEKAWQQVLTIAQSEEGTAKSQEGFYGRVPLEELVGVVQQLKDAGTIEEKYKILSEKATTGDLWYDIILGRVNDKLLPALGEEIGSWRNFMGENSGKRTWKRGLDLGTGTGNSLAELQKYCENTVGVDLLDFLLSIARQKSKESSLVVADVLKTPFKTGSFDIVQSNGLTFYLPKAQLERFVAEASRIIEPGGSYFQPYPLPPDIDGVLAREREYLSSGKALLACLADRLITKPYQENEAEPSEFALLSKFFEQRGFVRKRYIHRQEGVDVLEFKKKFPEDFEYIKREYSSDTYAAWQEVMGMLYGDRAAVVDLKHLLESDFLPEDKAVSNLHFLARLAREQEVIDAEPLSDYFSVFIQPLTFLATSERYSQTTRSKAAQAITDNLERVV